MGKSFNFSKAITDNMRSVATSVMNQVFNESNVYSTSNQVISISDVGGNVVVANNIITAVATINSETFFENVNSTEIKQKMLEDLTQAALAETKGLNIGLSIQNSQSVVKNFIEDVTNICNTITNTCKTSLSANQAIIVQQVCGNVTIIDNTLSQTSEIFSSCIATTVNNNNIVKEFATYVDNTASSKSTGINLFMLAILVAAVAGAFILVQQSLSDPTLVILIIGAVCVGIAIWLFLSYRGKRNKVVMLSTLFSRLLEKDCPNATKLRESTEDTKVEYVADECAFDNKCSAYDYRSSDVNPPKITFYSSYPSNKRCTDVFDRPITDTDYSKPMEALTGTSDIPPEGSRGFYMNTNNGKWFFRSKLKTEKWKERGQIKDKDGTVGTDGYCLAWGAQASTCKPENAANKLKIKVVPDDEKWNTFTVYGPDKTTTSGSTTTTTQTQQNSIPGPGPLIEGPDKIDYSGRKEPVSGDFDLWASVALGSIGGIAILFALFLQKTNQKPMIQFGGKNDEKSADKYDQYGSKIDGKSGKAGKSGDIGGKGGKGGKDGKGGKSSTSYGGSTNAYKDFGSSLMSKYF